MGTWGHVAAAGHHLHQLAATLGTFSYSRPERIGALGLAAEKVAVTAAGGYRRARGDDLGAFRGRHLLAQREREIVTVADVPDGGDAVPKCGHRRRTRGLQYGLAVVGRHMGHGILGAVPAQMHMGVDQSGKQPAVRPEVRHHSELRRRRSREVDVTDHTVLDEDHARSPDVDAVEDVSCT